MYNTNLLVVGGKFLIIIFPEPDGNGSTHVVDVRRRVADNQRREGASNAPSTIIHTIHGCGKLRRYHF
jgi:hypothetical protein